MDNVEIKTSERPELNLASRVEALRQNLVSALILMIVVSGTFTIYLYRQWNATRYDVNNMRMVVDEYTKTNLPAVREFVNRLNDYSKTHADLVPILAKYGVNNPTGSASMTPALSPMAAPSSKPRK